MPLTLPGTLQAVLGLETTTLCTLWTITRTDGVSYYYTDHDQEISYGGNLYKVGVGYNRNSVEDKSDLSVDELNVQGILTLDEVKREDIRGQRFDGATVTLTLVDYKNLSLGGVIRRKGWFGELRQNARGEFDVELRGLSQALAEGFTQPYTPGCTADLGDSECRVDLDTTYERVPGELIRKGEYFFVYDITDVIFQALTTGYFDIESNSDFTPYEYASVGETFYAEGNGTETAIQVRALRPWRYNFSVVDVTDLRTFEIAIGDSPLTEGDTTFFDGGLVYFDTGNNNAIAREVETFTDNSAGDGTVSCYLKFPFPIAVGDVGRIYPACDKTVATCKARFNNVLNFQGYPHVPGDKYLKDYPDAK